MIGKINKLIKDKKLYNSQSIINTLIRAMASRAFAIRRITKDLKEFEANPIEGVGLCLLNDKDLFQMLLNIEI